MGGDKTKITQFQEVAGALQEFKTYLFVKTGNAFCTVVNSPMKFMAISEATQHFQGRFIGFISDQMPSCKPTAVLFPMNKTWQWVKATVGMHGPLLLDYYETDPSRRGSLWTPAADCVTREGHVQRLLRIPLVLFELIRKQGCPLMPHEVLTRVLEYLENGWGDQAQPTNNPWELIVQWCVVAAQRDPQGDNLVSFSIKATTEGDDAYFGQVMENQLDGTMGKRPITEVRRGAPLAGSTGDVPANFAAELGKGVALGLHALSPFKTPAVAQGGLGDTETKKGYGEEDIAALMGFSHVKKRHQLQEIWSYFQSTGVKNIDNRQRQLMAHMNRWAHNRHIPIDTSVYMEGTTIKAIMELKFNPGEGSPTSVWPTKVSQLWCARDARAQRQNGSASGRKPSKQLRTPVNLMSSYACRKGSPGHLQITSGN